MKLPLNFSKLIGQFINLEPLKEAHISDLEVSFDPKLFDFYPKSYSSAREFVNENIQMQKHETFIPFVITIGETGEAIGCSEFSSIDEKNRNLEIGGTWLKTRFHGSQINSEAKLLLLQYAFEELKFLRVQFTVNVLNTRSRNALEKIGAHFEGIKRNAIILPNGRLRDDAYYSIISDEWLKTKSKIEERIKRLSQTFGTPNPPGQD